MPATALLTRAAPADVVVGPVTVYAGRLLQRDVMVSADRPVPVDALEHLVAQLNRDWTVQDRHSDLARLCDRPGVMVAVAPLTMLLVRNALTAERLARRAGLGGGDHRGLLDLRHGRAGLDPVTAAVAVRLAPAVAMDVLADFCSSSGATDGFVQFGQAVRHLGQPVAAWLEQVALDCQAAAAA